MSRSIDQIRTAILEAFTAPTPRRDAAGKKTKDPRPVSSPGQIYARKLRRLILSALDAEEPEWRALYELSHDASYVFCHPQSPDSALLEATRASLTDAQYQAVVAFLEWAADGTLPVDDRFRAITALRRLWTRFGVDTQRVAAFYEPFERYQRPPIEDPETESMARQIEAAFASTPYPAEIAPAYDDESCDVALTFDGMRWPWLTPEYLDIETAALSFFTPEAFRYFLPAYLLCNVGGLPINANPVFSLYYGVTTKHAGARERSVAKFALFSLEERTAIVAFLRGCVEGSYEQTDITEALESYWVPSLDFP